MPNKKVLIIVSYLQENGYDTEIFELHNLSGGLCISGKEKAMPLTDAFTGLQFEFQN